jgi:uracil-DNA glycosylase
VFLLNSVLTVRAREAGSHANKGWETFTDSAIRHLSQQREEHRLHFVGQLRHRQTRALIDSRKASGDYLAAPIAILRAQGFFGSNRFHARMTICSPNGQSPIHWA